MRSNCNSSPSTIICVKLYQFHAVGLGQVHAPYALQLQQLALDHHLRQADEQIEDAEISLAQRQLKRLHV
jgi:hypothetical protein